mmetsp:Transcript_10141/g.15497  ORF Transcript_10141/g.15497 Transcript_10141/m.15497 type:complete len:293 (+) Transcript_10141:77-955(+)
MRLAFDAHNHIHMGPNPPMKALVKENFEHSVSTDLVSELSGVAIMSTHPKDFPVVKSLATSIPSSCSGVHVVPCYGVHPWFLHELEERHWKPSYPDSTTPSWLNEIEQLIRDDPKAVVGEVGLDGFHFSPDSGELTTPMDKQIEVFEAQMELAAQYQRPVSIHTVQCMGQMLASLTKLKKSKKGLPPKIYFHAFGGKVGTIDQLLSCCGTKPGKTYFGFAPIINFRSPKTPEVVRKVGLERLVLETDHEDAGQVLSSMDKGISLIAEALNESRDTVIERTTQNAFDLYGISP